MSRETRFTTLQQRWQTAAETDRTLSFRARGRAMTSKDGLRLTRAHAAETRACDAFCAYLTEISPRAWGQGIPCTWLRTALTFADATTAEALSVVPPPAYGWAPQDLVPFTLPVSSPSFPWFARLTA